MSTDQEEMAEHVDISDVANGNQIFSAEYKDGQLQIVEVSPYDKTPRSGDYEPDESQELASDGENQYLQVLDSGKGLMQLDLINFTLVKNADGSSCYQMTCNDVPDSDDGTTITCVLSEQMDEEDPSDAYVVLQAADEGSRPGSTPPCLLLAADSPPEPAPPEPAPPQPIQEPQQKKPLTPVQILEKVKKLQKAKGRITSPHSTISRGRGRRRRGDLPPPMELLSSPGFKLYLYSCKMCPFKCNAVKDMTAHKKAYHTYSSTASRGALRGALRGAAHCGSVALRGAAQCARCPYRAHSHSLLLKHTQDTHTGTDDVTREIKTIELECADIADADILVCGACGFESETRAIFKRHIEEVHNATTTVF